MCVQGPARNRLRQHTRGAVPAACTLHFCRTTANSQVRQPQRASACAPHRHSFARVSPLVPLPGWLLCQPVAAVRSVSCVAWLAEEGWWPAACRLVGLELS